MKRRVYGDEIAAEPSMFLNEVPVELIEDLSNVPSWLRHKAEGNDLFESGDKTRVKKPGNYSGKTYNSVDSVMEFFKQRGISSGPKNQPPKVARPQPHSVKTEASGGFSPGARVRHAKYGVGEVLKREGAGDGAKLVINFPGIGLKKLIEKYAGLEPVNGIRR
jgi:DNA helicase-2/ATP-dependent DNA helicase PcrA